jgi:hypothetical protein
MTTPLNLSIPIKKLLSQKAFSASLEINPVDGMDNYRPPRGSINQNKN